MFYFLRTHHAAVVPTPHRPSWNKYSVDFVICLNASLHAELAVKVFAYVRSTRRLCCGHESISASVHTIITAVPALGVGGVHATAITAVALACQPACTHPTNNT